jgi:hypothetical protein
MTPRNVTIACWSNHTSMSKRKKDPEKLAYAKMQSHPFLTPALRYFTISNRFTDVYYVNRRIPANILSKIMFMCAIFEKQRHEP